ncbi:MAG: TldD/PmbA family protein [Caldilineae bacterium]|nr:TldD/PmbA family protein [Chloroflexota bacterium]MCB9176805.1 TldD/PmbA family protein [Caldilineae bacterium]
MREGIRPAEEVRTLLEGLLGRLTASEAQVTWRQSEGLATRFGENAITQNIGGASQEVAVDVWLGRRHGQASTNRLDPESLAETLARAEAIAAESPEDPEQVPLPGPQTYGERPQRFFPATAALEPGQVADDVARVVDAAKAAGYRASGLFEAGARAEAVANSRGLFGWQAETHADYSTTVHGPAGSGKAAASQSCRSRLDPAELARRAVENARLAQDPIAVEPGDYTVIFEPLATRGMLGFMGWVMAAREADEGSSVFSGRLGEAFLDPRVTLAMRTDDPELPAPLFGDAGLAIEPRSWIEAGVVRRLFHDRYWAAEQGTTPDAARLPLFMAGEDRSVEDLVAGCRRGLLVKNLWYIRFVDRKSLTLTGMTRDGVFLVEDGRITRPVKNLRWNESPITFLQNVVALSRAERSGGWGAMKLPGVLSEGFTFTSSTDSI